MYIQFYGFREKPFSLVPNPSYLFLSERHANALTFLEYGLTEKIGFVMLTGEIGIGKTTLIRYLLNQVEADMDVAVIFNTNVVSEDLIKFVLSEFEIDYSDGITKAKALEALYKFLIEKYSKGRKVLLIIDEAQNLSYEALEEIRMLSNLQTDEDMLLQIMIVGQPELKEKLNDPRLAQFAQRIAVSYHLSAMDLEQTNEYISHRIDKAGGRTLLFSRDAIETIFKASGGIPRTINLLCDASLVYGYADSKMTITGEIVDQVIEDKGGIGIITPQTAPAKSLPLAPDTRVDLLERMILVENNFNQLKELYHSYFKTMESQTDVLQEKMTLELKTALAQERRRSERFAVEYGRLKERYHLLLKKIKK